MQLTYDDWEKKIKVEPEGKAKNRSYRAYCPICMLSYSVDVLGSDSSARVLAFQKISSHLVTAHPDRVLDQGS